MAENCVLAIINGASTADVVLGTKNLYNGANTAGVVGIVTGTFGFLAAQVLKSSDKVENIAASLIKKIKI